mgnify:FL=1|jgi:hypothetical protein
MATRKPAAKAPAKTTARKTSKPEARATAEVTKDTTATKPRPAPRRKPQSREAVPETHAPASTAVPAGEERYRWIAHAAYLRAERRGFAPGQEVDDWLAAEAEFLAAFGGKAD